jgi:hypothetical protein
MASLTIAMAIIYMITSYKYQKNLIVSSVLDCICDFFKKCSRPCHPACLTFRPARGTVGEPAGGAQGRAHGRESPELGADR